MFCKKCGVELKEGAEFCARCGAPSSAAGGIVPEVQEGTAAVYVDKKPSSRKKWMI